MKKSMLPNKTDRTNPNKPINADFHNWEDNKSEFMALNPFSLKHLHEGLDVDNQNVFSMPDMLMPALRLENALTSPPPQPMDHLEIKQWLRVLCSVLFEPNDVILTKEIELRNDQSQPMLLRALHKRFAEKGNTTPNFRIHLHKANNGEGYVPISFSCDALQAGFCPAVCINKVTLDSPHRWISADDPIALLKRPENNGYHKALYHFLSFQGDSHGERIFTSKMRKVCEAIQSAMGRPNAAVVPAMLHPERLCGGTHVDDKTTWFTNKLALFEGFRGTGDAGLLPVQGSENQNCLIPFVKNLVSETTPTERVQVMDTCKIERIDMGYRVKFEYANRLYTKVYNEHGDTIRAGSTDIGLEEKIQHLAVWPNKACDNWKRYFVYLSCSINPTKTGKADSYVASAYTGGMWSDMSFAGNRQQYTGPRTEKQPIERLDYILEINQYPQLLSIRHGEDEVGLVIPEQDTMANIQPALAGEYFQMGIDFGTTNTIAYYFRNDRKRAIPIGDHRRLLIGASTDDLAFDFVADAEKGERPPFKTAVRTFLNPLPADGIAFHTSMAPLKYRKDLNRNLRRHLDNDLKWPRQLSEANKSEAFLEYMMLMWLWQLIQDEHTIPNRFLFTYPKAMTKGKLNLFKRTVPTILTRQKLAQFIPQDDARLLQMLVFLTEAEAVGPYLNDKILAGAITFHLDAGYILMDIGGGSVDISLWQKQDDSLALCSELSLSYFAGDHMQLEQICKEEVDRSITKNESLLLEILNVQENTARKDEDGLFTSLTASGSTPKDFSVLWSAKIEEIKRDLATGSSNEELQRRKAYVLQIELYFHYLFFLLGYLTGKAVAEKTFILNNTGPFGILMAGNGSQMYELADTLPNQFTAANKLMFVRGLQCVNKEALLNQIAIQSSPDRKHEVAYGASCTNPAHHGGGMNAGVGLDVADAEKMFQKINKRDELIWFKTDDKALMEEEIIKFFVAFIGALTSPANPVWNEKTFSFMFRKTPEAILDGWKTKMKASLAATVGLYSQAPSNLPEAIVKGFTLLEGDVKPIKGGA